MTIINGSFKAHKTVNSMEGQERLQYRVMNLSHCMHVLRNISTRRPAYTHKGRICLLVETYV